METKFGSWLKSRSFKTFFHHTGSLNSIFRTSDWKCPGMGSWTMALPSCFYFVFPFVSFAIFFICRKRKCFDAWAETDRFLFFVLSGL